MTLEENIKQAKEKARESADQIFSEKPDEVKKELERETVLGNPENLIKPDNKDE